MPREPGRIREQLDRAYHGGAWHGPSLREVLAGVDARAAAKRPIPNAHTIHEIAAHVLAWEKEALARLDGGGRDGLPPDEDWPDHPPGWTELLDELDTTHERLSRKTEALHDEALDQTVAGSSGTAYHLLHGIIQHNLYHAGQIAILKKVS